LPGGSGIIVLVVVLDPVFADKARILGIEDDDDWRALRVAGAFSDRL